MNPEVGTGFGKDAIACVGHFAISNLHVVRRLQNGKAVLANPESVSLLVQTFDGVPITIDDDIARLHDHAVETLERSFEIGVHSVKAGLPNLGAAT